jgi:phosphocarrier protein
MDSNHSKSLEQAPFYEKRVTIQNELGLHARPAALLVKTSSQFKSEIFITKNGETVNGKSIMGIMMLAASKGTSLLIRAEGEQCQEAVLSIEALILSKFGEE